MSMIRLDCSNSLSVRFSVFAFKPLYSAVGNPMLDYIFIILAVVCFAAQFAFTKLYEEIGRAHV